MRVLVNATTPVKGGGVQVAAAFICEAARADTDINWDFAVSSQVAEDLHLLQVNTADMHIFNSSPARSAAQRRRLRRLENQLQPDAVYTIFGPAYMRFKAPHLCGVAVGWVTHSTWLAFVALPGWLARMKTMALCIYKAIWLRAADRWVVEAENARQGLRRRLGISEGDVDIVPNSCAALFRAAKLDPAPRPEPEDLVRLVYVTAYYPHKNIELLPAVAAALKAMAPNRRFEFVITLPEDEPGLATIRQLARHHGVEGEIINVGRVSHAEIIDLYRDAQLCFMPSLLETFSASYPEAMALGRPIVASDLDFAHAVCGNAAVYFRAGDPEHAAQVILSLLDDQSRWSGCIRDGYSVVNALPSPREKFELYVQAIRQTAAEV